MPRLVLCIHKDSDYTDSTNFVFMDRKYVDDINNLELGQQFPQIIPSILVRNHEGKYLSYARKGNETRLHGSRSVLIGGHIDIEDIVDIYRNDEPFTRLIEQGAQRELYEEIGILRPVDSLDIITTLYTDKDAVSSVHLGLLIEVNLEKGEYCRLDEEINNDVLWLSKEELLSQLDKYEEWSKLAIQYLNK